MNRTCVSSSDVSAKAEMPEWSRVRTALPNTGTRVTSPPVETSVSQSICVYSPSRPSISQWSKSRSPSVGSVSSNEVVPGSSSTTVSSSPSPSGYLTTALDWFRW